MRTLYLDCGMGAAGDMLMAALLDLHPSPERFISELNVVLEGFAEVRVEERQSSGISAKHVRVLVNGQEEGETCEKCSHGYSGAEIKRRIKELKIPQNIKNSLSDIYESVLKAESKVHGTSLEHIHLHELGSIDALCDILGVVLLMSEVSPEKVVCSAVNLGGGYVKCAHGELSVPAPATAELIHGMKVYGSDIDAELLTPTGAALLKHYVHEFGPMPEMIISKEGRGCGTKEFKRANVVRAFLGDVSEQNQKEKILLECAIDDMTGEELGFLSEMLFSAGALDVYTSPIYMKKQRPAHLVSCVCESDKKESVLHCFFKHSSSIGIREIAVQRHELKRELETIDTNFGKVRVKKKLRLRRRKGKMGVRRP
jgi:uncharacterized protein (TIGR00299 family) protein